MSSIAILLEGEDLKTNLLQVGAKRPGADKRPSASPCNATSALIRITDFRRNCVRSA